MEVYLLRHGQTVMNEQHTLQGQSNSDLNDVGIRQAQQVRQKIEESGLEFQRIGFAVFRNLYEELIGKIFII